MKTKRPVLIKGPVDRTLTERERQVTQMIAEGLTNEGIGKALKIATKTVEAHRANIYRSCRSRIRHN